MFSAALPNSEAVRGFPWKIGKQKRWNVFLNSDTP
jgi:hypothetical protein